MKNAAPLILLSTTVLACSSSNGGKTPDASIHLDSQSIDARSIDAPPDAPACTSTTLDAQDIIDPGDGSYIIWGGNVTTDLGDGAATQQYYMQFYHTSGTDLTMPVDLSMGVQSDFATCDACLLVGTFDSMGNVIRVYYQSGGTLSLSTDPITAKNMMGTISNLSLVEVMIDQMNHSMPVAGGKCLSLGNVTLNHDAVPNAWTCAHAAYADSTNCDCMCGVSDPDCTMSTLPVVGCTANQVCASDACKDKATNDTCQTAATLTVGTPMDGSNFGATSNYNMGLETMTCTGFAQAGPDVAYKVHLTAHTAYTISLTNVGPNLDPSLSVVGPGAATLCDAATIACKAGADVGGHGEGETLTYTPTTTGNYYVIVDTYFTTDPGDTFTIEVTSP
jgi:hypothetical protein